MKIYNFNLMTQIFIGLLFACISNFAQAENFSASVECVNSENQKFLLYTNPTSPHKGLLGLILSGVSTDSRLGESLEEVHVDATWDRTSGTGMLDIDSNSFSIHINPDGSGTVVTKAPISTELPPQDIEDSTDKRSNPGPSSSSLKCIFAPIPAPPTGFSTGNRS